MPGKTRWRPDEPGRELIHRRMLERLAAQDGCITFLLIEVRALQRRIDALEKPTNAALRKQAHDNVEALGRVDQPADLYQGPR